MWTNGAQASNEEVEFLMRAFGTPEAIVEASTSDSPAKPRKPSWAARSWTRPSPLVNLKSNVAFQG